MTNPAFPTPSPPPRRTGRILTLLALLALIGGGVLWMHKGSETSAAKHPPHDEAVPVGLATIAKGDIDIIYPALGTVTPLATVTVRTQINGQLQEIGFQEGQIVKKDDFLAQIDPRPYQVALEQAQGALQKDQGLLKDAQINLARYQKLVEQNSISKQQLDTQTALVQQDEGNVAADQAQIDAAKLNVAYCHITAPITGRVGLRQVDAGNYVQTSDTNGIVVLTQLDPISVVFTLPEDQLPPIMKRLATGVELPVEAYDRGGATKLAEGKLTAVDSQINTSTGTIKLRAQFDNASGILFPNQFVNAQVKVDTVQGAIVAPQAAILRGSVGTFVYLAKDDGTVAVRPVKTGVSQGNNVEILSGLEAGDKVVVDGTDKLRDGAKYKAPESGESQDKK
ncbi:MAG: MdtA/MuxA family multidrug efflux RND transporter periplasmic adaptor subunit [Alphaproteobacteria bacterium]|nr:MdtA/MuxA family multidrug efflux RND transporter periplasmic adaptor subunit [Alphaproteobacteria bacterium]